MLEYNFDKTIIEKIAVIDNTLFLIIHSLNAILVTTLCKSKTAWYIYEGAKIYSIDLKNKLLQNDKIKQKEKINVKRYLKRDLTR